MQYGALPYARSVAVGVHESAIGWALMGYGFWLCRVYDQIDGKALSQKTPLVPPLGQVSSTARTAHRPRPRSPEHRSCCKSRGTPVCRPTPATVV